MSLRRDIDGFEPVRAAPLEHVDGRYEERATDVRHLAAASLACPACDAPVALAAPSAAPRDALACPYCAHAGRVRDFLSFATPSRPARVQVWVRTVTPRRPATARAR